MAVLEIRGKEQNRIGGERPVKGLEIKLVKRLLSKNI